MSLFREIIARFPCGGLSYVFAYGSGVKQQLGYKAVGEQKDNIIDLVFCVRDPLGWHAENISRHPSHYSALRLFGSEFVTRYQEQLAAGVYFNTLVPLSDVGVTIKYGVVAREQLIEDLLEWRHLYLAGRLHKPVETVVPATDDRPLHAALEQNLLNAFQVALLLLPETFSEYDLYHTISNLSYSGDFRMIFGENKSKVRNIVEAQQEELFKLYRPALTRLVDYVAVDFSARELGTNRAVTVFEQDKSQAANEFHLRNLPAKLRERLIRNVAYRGTYADIAAHLAIATNLRDVLQMSVNDIVWRSSITQSLKNIPSAGLLKSIAYGYHKALKTFSH